MCMFSSHTIHSLYAYYYMSQQAFLFLYFLSLSLPLFSFAHSFSQSVANGLPLCLVSSCLVFSFNPTLRAEIKTPLFSHSSDMPTFLTRFISSIKSTFTCRYSITVQHRLYEILIMTLCVGFFFCLILALKSNFGVFFF